ncbi:hypothetical protein [Sporichthya polymorpha]|uniref:NADH-quinone oxidoreductase subunit D-related protein n=1 Tax=Sporichthya polymorpha TaxID=35751 RepID=UPI00037D40E8|nr:hypothetical protein [Sporichthya polymorpha]
MTSSLAHRPAPARFRPSQEVSVIDLPWRAEALLNDGFRLALVTAIPEDDESHRIVYLFTAAHPDRRVELVARTEPGGDTVPSLALLSFPAGRFERELYETHGLLASSAPPRPGRLGAAAGPTRRSWETDAVGQRPVEALPRVEQAQPCSAFAHAVAFCLAVEDAFDFAVPSPVAAARAVLVELERAASHLRSIGAMCGDAGLTRWSAEALGLHHEFLALSEEITGHRSLRGAVVPGGVVLRGLPDSRRLRALEHVAAELREKALSSPALAATYRHRWILTNRHAAMTGALGPVARASGVDVDARRDHPFHPATAGVNPVTSRRGDALARLELRVGELGTGLRLLRDLLPAAQRAVGTPAPAAFGATARHTHGIGLVEGPQGTVAARVEIDPDGRVGNLRVVDPCFLTRSAFTLSQRGPHDENGSSVDPGFDLPDPAPGH